MSKETGPIVLNSIVETGRKEKDRVLGLLNVMRRVGYTTASVLVALMLLRCSPMIGVNTDLTNQILKVDTKQNTLWDCTVFGGDANIVDAPAKDAKVVWKANVVINNPFYFVTGDGIYLGATFYGAPSPYDKRILFLRNDKISIDGRCLPSKVYLQEITQDHFIPYGDVVVDGDTFIQRPFGRGWFVNIP